MKRREVFRVVGLICGLSTTGLLTSSTGCGSSSSPASGILPASENSDITRALPAVGPSRRGVQSIYWNSLPNDFAKSICTKMNASGKANIEIEYCPAYGNSYTNVNAAYSIIGSKLVLTTDFGHLRVASDKTPTDWGKDFCKNVFKPYNSKCTLIIQLANEDNYSDPEWKSLMDEIFKGILSEWGTSPFPYSNLNIRRTPTASNTTVPKYSYNGHSFSMEREYHFPASGNFDKNNKSSVVSNDGWVVGRTDDPKNKDPNPWAYLGGNQLKQTDLASFKNGFGSSTLLLWHPILHNWSLKDGKSDIFDGSAPRMTVVTKDVVKQQQRFLDLLGEFMK